MIDLCILCAFPIMPSNPLRITDEHHEGGLDDVIGSPLDAKFASTDILARTPIGTFQGISYFLAANVLVAS